jgi:hypothetical protein
MEDASMKVRAIIDGKRFTYSVLGILNASTYLEALRVECPHGYKDVRVRNDSAISSFTVWAEWEEER